MPDLGDVVPLSVTVRDADGNPANATAVTLTVTLPDGTTGYSGTITPTSTGVYEHDYATTVEGRHVARWVATGSNASSFVDVFNVDPADPGYLVSLADLRDHLQLDDTDLLTHGEELRRALRSASATVEALIGPVVPRTVVETLPTFSGRYVWLSTTPVLTLTSATTSGVSVDITGWTVETGGRVDAGYVTTRSGLVLTYRAGRATVPPEAREATVELVRDRVSFSQAGGGGRRFRQLPDDDVSFSSGRPAVPPYVYGLLEPLLLPPAVA